MNKNNKNCSFYVEGMHCSSCELLIEKKLSKVSGINNVDANLNKSQVKIEFTNKLLDIRSLNNELKPLGYKLVDSKPVKQTRLFSMTSDGQLLVNKQQLISFIKLLAIVVAVLAVFSILNANGAISEVSLNSGSALSAFFVFGFVASVSTCAALTGGLMLSMGKSWNEQYIAEPTRIKAIPHFLFHFGRLISFVIFGGLLGILGSSFKINTQFNAILVLIVSAAMVILGLQMLEVKWAQSIRLSIPKLFTIRGTNIEESTSRFSPFMVGVATFIIPCSFTLIAQTAALSSGSFTSGAAIMLAFAAGSLPVLGIISLSIIKFNTKPKLTANFNLVAGVIVIFLALYNFNSQLNVLGLPSLSDIQINMTESNSAEVINGKQVITMNVDALGYRPSLFTVKAGQPVRWEINATDKLGCASVLIAQNVLQTPLTLKPGQNTAEFTLNNKGSYKFTCGMGMYSGIIEVI